MCLHVGATPNQSLTNMQQWLDSIATTLCHENPLVTDNVGVRISGVFHQIRGAEHRKFLQTLTSHFMWSTQCATHLPGPVSAGKLLTVEPSGYQAFFPPPTCLGSRLNTALAVYNNYRYVFTCRGHSQPVPHKHATVAGLHCNNVVP